MGVSADDNVELCGSRIEVKLLNVVQNVYQGRASLDDCRSGQVGRPILFVNISSHCDDRGKCSQLVDDPRFANVAGVDDQIGSFECGQRLLSKEAVSVRDHPNDSNVDHLFDRTGSRAQSAPSTKTPVVIGVHLKPPLQQWPDEIKHISGRDTVAVLGGMNAVRAHHAGLIVDVDEKEREVSQFVLACQVGI